MLKTKICTTKINKLNPALPLYWYEYSWDGNKPFKPQTMNLHRHKRSSFIAQEVLMFAYSLIACDRSFGLKFLLRDHFREWVTICHKSSSINAKSWDCRVVEWQSLHEIPPGPTWKLKSESWGAWRNLDRNNLCMLVGRNIAPTKISSQ